MRALLALLMLVGTAPAEAGEWRRYENAAFGYFADLPADLGLVAEDAGGVAMGDATTQLSVFGIEIAPMAFEQAAQAAMASTEADGFAIQARTLTPRMVRYAAVSGARQLAAGLLLLCGDQAVAGYELTYYSAEAARVAPMLERLSSSLRATRC